MSSVVTYNSHVQNKPVYSLFLAVSFGCIWWPNAVHQCQDLGMTIGPSYELMKSKRLAHFQTADLLLVVLLAGLRSHFALANSFNTEVLDHNMLSATKLCRQFLH